MHRIDRYGCILAVGCMIAVGEFVGGVKSHSLSLISDAFHVLTDLPAIMATLIAEVIVARNRGNEEFDEGRCRGTFGVVSALLLAGGGLGVIWSAMARLEYGTPQIVTFQMMLWTAIGLVGNGVMLAFMTMNEGHEHGACDKHEHADLSHAALMRHIATDLGQSVAVFAGGAAIAMGHTPAIDVWLGFAIGCLMLFWAKKIMTDSLKAIRGPRNAG